MVGIMARRIFVLILTFTAAFCAEKSRNLRSAQQCPQPNFAPSVPGEKHCIFSHGCSKVECSVSGDSRKLTLTLKINKCQEPLTATVTLKQPENSLDWSHTLKNGEKAELPTNTRSFTGDLPISDPSLFIKVGLKRINGSSVNYTVSLVGHVTAYGQVDPVNVILLQGESPVVTTKCGLHRTQHTAPPTPTRQRTEAPTRQHVEAPTRQRTEAPTRRRTEAPTRRHAEAPTRRHATPTEELVDKKSYDQQQCPAVHFVDGTSCPVSNHCSKITCTSRKNSEYGGQMVLTVQMNGCSEPLTATVTMESSPLKWSHTFEDGEKVGFPVPSGVASKVNIFFNAELKEKNGRIKFKLIQLMEPKEENMHVVPVTLLDTELPATKCKVNGLHQAGSSGPWFSSQPIAVRVAVILVPVIAVVLVGLGVAFCYCKYRGGGMRYPIHISRGGGRVPMQRLVNEA